MTRITLKKHDRIPVPKKKVVVKAWAVICEHITGCVEAFTAERSARSSACIQDIVVPCTITYTLPVTTKKEPKPDSCPLCGTKDYCDCWKNV
jgi:hypothetical protein